MDNVCNRCLFSIPSKVEMAEEQEHLYCFLAFIIVERPGILLKNCRK